MAGSPRRTSSESTAVGGAPTGSQDSNTLALQQAAPAPLVSPAQSGQTASSCAVLSAAPAVPADQALLPCDPSCLESISNSQGHEAASAGTALRCSLYPGQMERLKTAQTVSAHSVLKAASASSTLRCNSHPGQMERFKAVQAVSADCGPGDLGAEHFQVQICQKGILAHQISCDCDSVGMASQAVTHAVEISTIDVSLEELCVGSSVSC